jgi:hypothetical protein
MSNIKHTQLLSEDANQKAERQVEVVFQEILNSFPDYFNTPIEKSKLKLAISTAFVDLAADRMQGNIDENLNPNYVSNVYAREPIGDSLGATIYKDGKGGYVVSLELYSTRGRGMAQTREMSFSTAAVPLEQFTSGYIINQLNDRVNIDQDWTTSIDQLVDDVTSKINEKSSLRERVKDMIREELMGDNDERELRQKYLMMLDMYKKAPQHIKDELKPKVEKAAEMLGITLDLNEGPDGLWKNIRDKRERGEKPASRGSKAYKKAVEAGKRINAQK